MAKFGIGAVGDLKEVRVAFSMATFQEDGEPIEVVHVFRPEFGRKLQQLAERLDRAGRDMKGDKRDDARDGVYFDVWEQLIVRVENYEAADTLAGPALVEYFKGQGIPADTPPELAARFKDVLRRHVAIAVQGYFRSQGATYGSSSEA